MNIWNLLARNSTRNPYHRRQTTPHRINLPEQLETRQLLSASKTPVDQATVQAAVQATPSGVNPPYVVSIAQDNPGPITTSTATFTVTFNKPVTGVTAQSFVAHSASANTPPFYAVKLTTQQYPLTVTPISSSVYQVTVSTTPLKGAKDPIVSLDVFDSGLIKDSASQRLFGTWSLLIMGHTLINDTSKLAPTTQAFSGDINGDGKSDLISNKLAGGVEYSMVNSAGIVANPVAAPNVPNVTSVGDVNGDGKADLISVSVAIGLNGAPPASGTFTAWLGNGSGQFTAKTSVTANWSTGPSALGDFNGDGKLDLLAGGGSAGANSNNLGLALGNGDGTFQPFTVISTQAAALKLIPADLNKDGKLDLVVGTTTGMGVLLGNGNGTFSTMSLNTSVGAMRDVAVGDVSGDGKPDIVFSRVASDTASARLSLFISNGDGTFQDPKSYDSTLFTNTGAKLFPKYVALMDINGDGYQDAIWSGGPDTAYLFGNSTGFSELSPAGSTRFGKISGINGINKDISTLVAGDYNGDGATDMAFAGTLGGLNIEVAKSSGDFLGPQGIPIKIAPAPTGIALSATTVNENQDSAAVGTLSSTSVDKKATFTYSLVAGDGSTDNSSFTISGTTLKSVGSFNYEVKNTYSIRIRSTNASGASFEKVFTIKVGDVNDRPTGPSTSQANVQVGAPKGTVVAVVSSTPGVGKYFFSDEDAGQKLTYSLGNSGPVKAFAINPTTGQLTIANPSLLSGFAPNSSVALTITVADSGKPKLTRSMALSVKFTGGIVDTPAVVTLDRGTADPIASEATGWTVTFSKPVTGLSSSNFTVVTTGGATADSQVIVTRISDTQYTATVTGINIQGSGTVGLNFVDPNGVVRDANNNGLGENYLFTGQTYTVLPIPPDTTPVILSILKSDQLAITGTTADFCVIFNEPVTGVTSDYFTVNVDNGVTANSTVEITKVGGGSVYLVRVSGVAKTGTDGTLSLDFFGSASIKDANDHALPDGYSYGGLVYSVQ